MCKCMFLKNFTKWTIPGLFLSFLCSWQCLNILYNKSWCLKSNPGLVVYEVTALPTVPQHVLWCWKQPVGHNCWSRAQCASIPTSQVLIPVTPPSSSNPCDASFSSFYSVKSFKKIEKETGDDPSKNFPNASSLFGFLVV